MTVRAGILGTGWGVRVQVAAFRQAGLEVGAIWSRRLERAREAAARLEIPFATDSWRELLERQEIDLASICTPPHLHEEISRAALERGKHVLCEKPAALDAVEAGRMLEAAAARPGRLALIDHELRLLPERRRMRELLAAGAVGTVRRAAARHLSGGRLKASWLWGWWSERALGGGALGAIGSHQIDALRWLLGSEPEEVIAELSTAIPERPDESGALRPVTADEQATLVLRFAGGAAGTVTVSGVEAGPTRHVLEVAGEEGRLRLEGRALVLERPGGEREEIGVDDPLSPRGELQDNEWSRGTLYLLRAIRRALEDGDAEELAEAATFADGLAVQRALDAARRSAESRRWEAVA